MSADINTVSIIGRLVRDSELRFTATGTAICNFSIAVNRRVKKSEGWEDVASFFDLALFAKQAEGLNKYLVKGTQVAIQGYIEQQRWQKDGQNHSKVVIGVNEIQLIGSKGGGQREGSSPAQPTRQQGDDFDPSVYEESVPF